MDSPFQFGKLATEDNFIDRIEDRRQLKQMLSSNINVALISPRRWGKSSLVEMAMKELVEERKEFRVCYIDAFSINSETEFYNAFASNVISCAAGKMEKAIEDVKKYLGNLFASLTIGNGLSDFLSVKIGYKPQEADKLEILNLPERIAKDRGIRIIVCIDEFQQLVNLPEYHDMEGKMRTVWQKQTSVSYCFYGSKKHMMMEIFADSQKPFYRFANIIFMQKIKKEDWIPFICKGFEKTGKHISLEFAERICDIVECHSWYLQQYAFYIWSSTETDVNEDIMQKSLKRLIDTNSPMFISDTEKLTPSQRAMLRAIRDEVEQLSSAESVQKYHLGNPNTINRNKKVLQEKSFIDMEGGKLIIADPVFKHWYK
ncbi:MAG: AAA family ATPase [Bacteroidales bacterium]|nr:AAA family ATPase [Bacteroidales bacterium]